MIPVNIWAQKGPNILSGDMLDDKQAPLSPLFFLPKC